MNAKKRKNPQKFDPSKAQLSDFQILPLIMNHIPQAIFWKDRNLVYLGCNQAFTEDAGFSSPEEIVGKTDFDMPWKDQAELYRADDRLVMDNGEPKLNYEEPQTTPDGSTIWLSTSKIPVFENGQVVAVLGMYEDITARKQVEEANERGKQRLETILETTRIPTIISRLSDGIVLYANQALAQVSQVNLDKLIGFKTGNFYANPDDRKTVLESLRQHGHIDDFEVQFQRTDGSRYWALLSSRVTEYEGEPCVLSTYTDITERKQADQTLRESQRLLQLVMDNIPQAVFWKDKDLVYLGANQAFSEDAGLDSPQELIGKTDFDMPWQEQAELYRADDQKVMDEGVPKLNYEEPQTGPTGEITWLRTSKVPIIDDDGNVFAVLGMYEDITERKRLEARVQDAFERRGYQVQVSNEISQQISQATELGDLFDRVVTLTKEKLGYYHTQLLRYDPNQNVVVLTAGYGETGQKMFTDGHRMPMGSGLIGTAAATGETVMRSELAQDPDWKPNPLLPDTKGEIAVPIKLGDEVLGVLDVQSDQADALSDDDRLLLEGLCGQIAIAMEQTRLRQEMEERLQEINNLYRSMSHEGWQTYRETMDLPGGFVYDQIAIRSVDETGLAKGLFANAPMVLPGGEMLGELGIADDPDEPLSEDDKAFLEQVSEQVALALESARLSEQTQFALSQSERLFDASRSLTQSADLQELVAATVKTLDIPVVNRAVLTTFDYDAAGDIEQLTVLANWWNGDGHEVTPIGTRYSLDTIKLMPMFVSPTPIFFDDAFSDERVDATTLEFVKKQNLRAVAVLPLHLGSQQIGALILEAEDSHDFTPAETRLFESLAPQIATVLENRQQYEKAQRQAEREAMLNAINQKIQSATSVEAVLQIAARELGHALGAPMTVAQLSMKDQN